MSAWSAELALEAAALQAGRELKGPEREAVVEVLGSLATVTPSLEILARSGVRRLGAALATGGSLPSLGGSPLEELARETREDTRASYLELQEEEAAREVLAAVGSASLKVLQVAILFLLSA